MHLQRQLLQKLLLKHGSKGRLWSALFALSVGTTLLLLSVMIWWNFQELLQGKRDNDSLGSTFLTISKKVTDENMGRTAATLFSPAEIDALHNAPQVQDVGALTSNRFPVYATFSSGVGFSTELFLEAVPDKFMDKTSADWEWSPGSNRVPIIISSEFLNLYNYGFALSQGLPQLSEKSIQSIAFELTVGRGTNEQHYMAQIVGFSDRISSVLVPVSFINYGNATYAGSANIPPSRLVVKISDPSDRNFVNYLQEHEYSTNAEQLRWNKLRSVMEAVTIAVGALAIIFIVLGALVFILFIELTITRAKTSIVLLLQLGYSPAYLGKYMTSRFLPLVLFALLVAMVLAALTQAIVATLASEKLLSLATVPGWPVWVVWIANGLLLVVLIRRAIRIAIRKQ